MFGGCPTSSEKRGDTFLAQGICLHFIGSERARFDLFAANQEDRRRIKTQGSAVPNELDKGEDVVLLGERAAGNSNATLGRGLHLDRFHHAPLECDKVVARVLQGWCCLDIMFKEPELHEELPDRARLKPLR